MEAWSRIWKTCRALVQRRGEDRAADHVERRAARGRGDQIEGAHNGQRRPDAVGDGVGQNVAEMLRRLHKMMIVQGYRWG
jgi:hypothetical protein